METKQRVNRIELIGNIGKAPEVKYFPSGACKVTASLAVTRKVKEEKVTDWFNLEAWADTAEKMAENVGKGQRLWVAGQMINDTWTDAEGKKRDKWIVKVYEWRKMESAENNQDQRPADTLDDEVPF